ncbi:MAG: hypothetical protein BWX88_04949 [Planctomycetes bacterium ADurb.Bin126]|nr:MAG: hypothetical protein BWX88_04949 [Planctomycetes bacterium ADurb.Bin126]HOD81812.1 hypothetical protein [Phycisphaerae bacterium]HQL75532.1 hypothetical protein [Phycisphaerae bacterium]
MAGDRTTMGGPRQSFQTTAWTQLAELRAGGEPARKAAIQQLIEQYWKPIYCYLRRKGCDNEDAKDLTQGFLQDVVLGKDLAAQADQAKGRFRTFLLSALDRYVVSAHRARTTLRRQPKGRMVALDAMENMDIPGQVSHSSPEKAFAYAWASSLLDQVLADVKATCCQTGKSVHWEVFRLRVVQPCLREAEPLAMGDICRQYGIESEEKASNMMVTIKRAFQKHLRRRVQQWVDSDDDIDAEIQELMQILAWG